MGDPPRSHGHWTRTKYIVIVVKYVPKWAKVELVKYFTSEVTTKFIYENIIIRFVCPDRLISDRGTPLIKKTIYVLLKEFKIDNNKKIIISPIVKWCGQLI